MNRLRKLIPQSPWCATVAAWCALVSMVVNALMLAMRFSTTVWQRIEVWRIQHGLDPLVAPDPAAGNPEPIATMEFSVVLLPSNILLLLALFGVAHVLRILTPLRILDSCRTKPRGGAVALATALGTALAVFAVPLFTAIVVNFAAGLRDGLPVFAPGLAWTQMAFSVLDGIAVVLGLAVLPFCLLRLADRRYAAPPANSPEDADVRCAETWLSIVMTGGAAAFAGDVAWRLLSWTTRFHVDILALDVAAFASSLVLPVLSLCVLAAMRDALRRLLAEGSLPDEPGQRTGPFAAVVVLLAVSFVSFFLLFRHSGGTGSSLMDVCGFAILAAVGAQLAFCAVLVGRLPVPPGGQPSPPSPAFAGSVRARIGLALGIAALACAVMADLGVAAPLLAASAALCYGVRRSCPRTANAGLAAAALALVFLLAFTLRLTVC